MNRTENDFASNLRFGIRAWQSIEFVLITKHEIITEEFCAQLPLQCEINSVTWSAIHDFLALKCSAGAVSITVKEQLAHTLRQMANNNDRPPIPELFDALLLVLHNLAMQNYYKSNPAAYAQFTGTCFQYLLRIIAVDAEFAVSKLDAIRELITTVSTFIKNTPLLTEFRDAFTRDGYLPLVELTLRLHTELSSLFFPLVTDLYLNGDEATAELHACLKRTKHPTATTRFQELLDGPTYSAMLLIETILLAHRNDLVTQALLHKYMLKKDVQIGTATYYLQLLRKLEIPMTPTMLRADVTTGEKSSEKVVSFIGRSVNSLCTAHFDTNLTAVLRLLIAALELEPMMFEHLIFPIVVQCMLARKDDERMILYEHFMGLVIDIYRRLSRAEKFVSQLIRSLSDRLKVVKLTKKSKRKSNCVLDGFPDVKKGVLAANGVNDGKLRVVFKFNPFYLYYLNGFRRMLNWPTIF